MTQADRDAFVTLRFTGDDLDPQDISAILPVKPTRAHKKAEEFFAGKHAGTLRGRTRIWFLATDKLVHSDISPIICSSCRSCSIRNRAMTAGYRRSGTFCSGRIPAPTSPASGAAIPAKPRRNSRLNSNQPSSRWPQTSEPISQT